MSRASSRSSSARPRVAAAAVPAVAAVLLLLAASRTGADTITYSGDSVKATLAEGSERAVLTGNARLTTSDSVIRADEITLYGTDFTQAIARGRVHVADAKRGVDLTADELLYDRQAKIARIRGNAVMADLKNEIVVKGGFIEDRDTEGLTLVQIGVRILKKDLVCRAEFAKYWRDRKLLELTGMPFVTRKGDEYRATRITIDLETEEITLEGEVQGTASSGGEAEQGGPGSTAPAGGGTGSPAAAEQGGTSQEGGSKP